MKPIYIECEYTILKKNSYSKDYDKAIFYKKIESINISAEVSYQENNIIVKIENVVLEDSFIKELLSNKEILSQECKTSIYEIIKLGRDFTREILGTIKYHLNYKKIKEPFFAIKSESWGFTSVELKKISSKHFITKGHAEIWHPLDEETINLIQTSLDNQIKPLTAMKYLHRAFHENLPHHKWIDATIAAELAIKEVLCIAKPELEILLLEMPSPPLTKLYGDILEEYLGEASPYKSKIKKGIEVRNKLVHRHDTSYINGQEAIIYVENIGKAILHLLTLLYPNDKLIERTYKTITFTLHEYRD